MLPIDVSAESSSRAKIHVWSISVSLIPAHCKDHGRCLLNICSMIKKIKISGSLEPSPLSMGCDRDKETSTKKRTQEVLWDEARSVYRGTLPGAGPGPCGLRSSSWVRGSLMSYWLANCPVAIWRCGLTPCWLACPRHKALASPGVWVWHWDACFCLLRVPVGICLRRTRFLAWPLDESFSVLEEFDREARENGGYMEIYECLKKGMGWGEGCLGGQGKGGKVWQCFCPFCELFRYWCPMLFFILRKWCPHTLRGSGWKPKCSLLSSASVPPVVCPTFSPCSNPRLTITLHSAPSLPLSWAPMRSSHCLSAASLALYNLPPSQPDRGLPELHKIIPLFCSKSNYDLQFHLKLNPNFFLLCSIISSENET